MIAVADDRLILQGFAEYTGEMRPTGGRGGWVKIARATDAGMSAIRPRGLPQASPVTDDDEMDG